MKAIQAAVRHGVGTQSSLPPVEELDDGETETEVELPALDEASAVMEIASPAKGPEVEG